MSAYRLLLSKMGITAHLMFWFLVIALVPSVALTGITTYLSRRSLELSVRDRLILIAEGKLSQLDGFVRERRGDAYVLGTAPGVYDALTALSQGLKEHPPEAPENVRLREKYRRVFARFVDIYRYQNIHLLTTDGVVLMSYEPFAEIGRSVLTGPLQGTEFADVFTRSKMLLSSALSDYQLYPGRKDAAAFMAGPVMLDGVLLGVVLLEFGNTEVFRNFQKYAGLGETGETLVAMRKGDEVTFVSPSRFDATSAFRKKLRYGDREGVPMQRATKGERAYGRSIDYRGHDVVGVWSYIPSFRWGIVVKQDASEAFELVYHQRLATLGLLGFTIVLVTIVALILSQSISRPIKAAASASQAVAAGDLTRELQLWAPGEAGQLLDAIRRMTENLRSLIGKIQKSSVALMSTATEIAATSKQQEQTIIDYGSSTNEAAAAVQEISATSRELVKTMNEVNEVAGQTGEMAASGQQGLSGMDRTMRLLAESTSSISGKLSVISERAANINLAVTTITKVADQTNLLSINAAIEAEKAGEYGLGFLVVAREIRRLADQTAVATLDIERMVKEMQSSVAAGVMEMDKFTDQVRQGVGEVAHISEQLARIIDAVQGLTDRFEQVTEGMRVQAIGADQIREAVVRINEGANQTSISIREFNKATNYMREAVGTLKEEVSHFKLSEGDPGSTSRPRE